MRRRNHLAEIFRDHVPRVSRERPQLGLFGPEPPAAPKPGRGKTATKPEPAEPPKAPPAPEPPAAGPKAKAPRGPSVRLSSSDTWRPADEQNAFVLVVGGSGSGKTNALKVIASDLTDAQVPVIVFDLHGDLALPGFESVTLGGRLGIAPLQLPSFDASAGGPARHVASLIEAVRAAAPGLGALQAFSLKNALIAAYAAAGFTDDPRTWRRAAPSLGDVLKRLQDSARKGAREAAGASINGLLSVLDSLFGDPLFNQAASLPVERLLRGRLRVDLSQVPEGAQVLAIDAMLRQLYGALRARGPAAAGELRSFVVCDEAAILVRSPVLPILFREARKFGLGMALAAQLADDFGKALRANAGTLIVLRNLSACEVRTNARELCLPEPELRALNQRGQALVRTMAGTKRIQLRAAEG